MKNPQKLVMKVKYTYLLPTLFFAGIVYLCSFHLISILRPESSKNNLYYFMHEGYRLWHIECMCCAWEETGIPMIQCYDQIEQHGKLIQRYSPVEGIGDDLGAYYVLQQWVNRFSISVQTAYFVFYISVVLLSFILCSFFIFYLFKRMRTLIMCHGVLCVFSFLCLYILNVYVFYLLAIAMIPVFVIIHKNFLKNNIPFIGFVFLFIMGFMAGGINQFRLHAGTGFLLFVMLYLFIDNKKPLRLLLKISVIISLVLSSILPDFALSVILKKRDVQVTKLGNRYFNPDPPQKQHGTWLQMFLGLGYFTNNKYGIIYKDEYAFDKVKETHPDMVVNSKYVSGSFPPAVKKLYMEILLKDPFFVIKTYLAKFLHALFFWMLFANFGIVYLIRFVPEKHWIIPIVITTLFYLLPGVLSWPLKMYILGALSIGAFLTIYALGRYLDEGKISKKM